MVRKMTRKPNVEDFDWVKRCALAALCSQNALKQLLVFKGGNLLQIGFNIRVRASIDLDFSIDADCNPEQVRAECESALTAEFSKFNYAVIDVTIVERPPELSEDLRDFWGGYRIGFKLVKVTTFDRFRTDLAALRRYALPFGHQGSTVFRMVKSRINCDSSVWRGSLLVFGSRVVCGDVR